MQRRFLRKRGAAGKALLGASGLNSLSQSLTALTAPSGREPLARPGTLHFSGELSRYAKGPIPEDDFPRPGEDVAQRQKGESVAVGDWGSWLPGITPFGAAANFPAVAEAVPLGKVAATNGSRRKGFFSVTLPYKTAKHPLKM